MDWDYLRGPIGAQDTHTRRLPEKSPHQNRRIRWPYARCLSIIHKERAGTLDSDTQARMERHV